MTLDVYSMPIGIEKKKTKNGKRKRKSIQETKSRKTAEKRRTWNRENLGCRIKLNARTINKEVGSHTTGSDHAHRCP